MSASPSLKFDHVAIAAADPGPVLDQLVGRLGATPLYGAVARGFRWVLLHAGSAAGGMLIEVIQPWSIEDDPFLARFLERRGPGVHHLTFKTGDIRRAISDFDRLGSPLVDQQLTDPRWREGFLRPGDAFGTVVQVVQTSVVRPPLAEMLQALRGRPDALAGLAGGIEPDASATWWTAPPTAPTAVALQRVVLAAPDPHAAARFYETALGGEPLAPSVPGTVELAWPGGEKMRFQPSGGAPAGIVALEFESAVIAPFSLGQTAVVFGTSAP